MFKGYARLVLLALAAGVSGCQVPNTSAPKPKAPAVKKADDKAVVLDILQDIEPAFSKATSYEPGDIIRVASYNIQNYTDGENDGYHRSAIMVERQTRAAAAIVNGLGADILVIQEIENATVLSRLNKALDKPYPVGYITDFVRRGRKDKLNIALLSRLPITGAQELDFGMVKHPARLSRGTLSFQVDLGEDHRMLLYGVHLKSNYGESEVNIAKRTEQLKILRAHSELVMESDKKVTWEGVIIGDTNVDPDLPSFAEDPSFDPIADWIDLWRGAPMPDRNTIPMRKGDPDKEFASACFDRIFVLPELKKSPWAAGMPVSIQKGVDPNIYVDPGENETHASDHYPVYVDIRKD